MNKTNQTKNYLALGVLSPAKPNQVDTSQATQNPLITLNGNTSRRNDMKHTSIGKVIKSLFVTALVAGFLAACSSTPTPDFSGKATSEEPQVYLVDGVAHSPSQMQTLAIRNADLYYAVTPETFAKGQVYVFTKEADYLSFKKTYKTQLEQGLSVQGNCVWNFGTDTDTRTTLYKNTGYGGDLLRLNKGSSYNRAALGSFDQAISSVKGACSVWTDLYDNGDYTGTVWSTFGDNYRSLPSWINNDASSVKVGQ